MKIRELEAALAVKSQETVELAATITQQQRALLAKEQQILELLKALRGKQREHVRASAFEMLLSAE